MWHECNGVVVWAFFGIVFLWDWNENWPFPVLWPLLSFPDLLAYWVQHLHSILIAKFRLKLEKVGKTTRPFRYDLNKIPCYYTVEVTNRFKGLDLTDRVPEELRMKVCDIVQETVIKTISKKKKCKKVKWLSEEGLQIAVGKKKEKQKAKKKRKDTSIRMQSSKE